MLFGHIVLGFYLYLAEYIKPLFGTALIKREYIYILKKYIYIFYHLSIVCWCWNLYHPHNWVWILLLLMYYLFTGSILLSPLFTQAYLMTAYQHWYKPWGNWKDCRHFVLVLNSMNSCQHILHLTCIPVCLKLQLCLLTLIVSLLYLKFMLLLSWKSYSRQRQNACFLMPFLCECDCSAFAIPLINIRIPNYISYFNNMNM